MGKILISIILLCCFLPINKDQVIAKPVSQIGKATYVAHAMGRIDGHDYTNSLEAFLHNYEIGFRVFEVDMVLSADSVPIARHSGSHMFEILGQNPPQRILEQQTEPFTSTVQGVPLTLGEFKNLRINKKYTPMDIYDLIALLQKYPDISFLIDHGYNFFTLDARTAFYKNLIDIVCKTDPTLMDRIIPNTADGEFLEVLTSLYPFKNIIYVLFKENDEAAFELIKKTNAISTVFMSPSLALNTDYVKRAKELGKWVYVVMGTSNQQVENLMSHGVDGVYADILFN